MSARIILFLLRVGFNDKQYTFHALVKQGYSFETLQKEMAITQEPYISDYFGKNPKLCKHYSMKMPPFKHFLAIQPNIRRT